MDPDRPRVVPRGWGGARMRREGAPAAPVGWRAGGRAWEALF